VPTFAASFRFLTVFTFFCSCATSSEILGCALCIHADAAADDDDNDDDDNDDDNDDDTNDDTDDDTDDEACSISSSSLLASVLTK